VIWLYFTSKTQGYMNAQGTLQMHLMAMLEPNTWSPAYPPSSGSSIINILEISFLVWEGNNDLPDSLTFWRCGAFLGFISLTQSFV